MGIGVSVFLIALGAILAFATDVSLGGLDLTVVGYILIGAGVLGLAMTLLVFAPRRRRVLDPAVDPAVDQRTVVERPVRRRTVVEDTPATERRVYDDPRY